MADNYNALTPLGTPPDGTELTPFRSTEIGTGGPHVQHVFLAGADGNRLITVPITVEALPLPTGAATETTLASVLTALASVAVTGPLTDTELRASAVPVSLATAPLATDAATQTTLAAVLSQLQATLDVALTPDARNAALASIEVTLSGTPGTVTTVTIPDYAQGFRLYPRTNNCRFAIGEDPAAVGASSSTTIAAAAFGAGGAAKADQWETRLLAAGTSRTVRLRSTTASVVIDMEVF